MLVLMLVYLKISVKYIVRVLFNQYLIPGPAVEFSVELDFNSDNMWQCDCN